MVCCGGEREPSLLISPNITLHGPHGVLEGLSQHPCRDGSSPCRGTEAVAPFPTPTMLQSCRGSCFLCSLGQSWREPGGGLTWRSHSGAIRRSTQALSRAGSIIPCVEISRALLERDFCCNGDPAVNGKAFTRVTSYSSGGRYRVGH